MSKIFSKLYTGDCTVIANKIPDSSIDLIITSPPYNVDLGNNKYKKSSYDFYRDNKNHKKFIHDLKIVFYKYYSKLVKGGRCCINIGDGKNGMIPTTSDIIQMMTMIGYIPMTHIIWNKKTTSARTAWGSWLSPSCPSFPTPFEHILVFCKETIKLIKNLESITDLTSDEFTKWAYALWEFPGETKQKQYGHPAMFPLELPIRCIKMFSWVGATVLDPFCGVGTTGVACKRLNRNFYGIDISKNYIIKSRNRIKKEG